MSTAPNMSRGRMVPVPILLASRQNSYYIDDLIRQRINDVKINNLNSHRITWLTNNSQITVMNSLFSSSLSRLLIVLLSFTTANFDIWQLLRLAGRVTSSRFIKQCGHRSNTVRIQYTNTKIIYNKTMIYRMLACRSMTHSIIWNYQKSSYWYRPIIQHR